MSKLRRILVAGDPLPEDLIIEILLRLPAVSILRFSSVCREWCTIIRSQTFIDDHHRFKQVDGTSLVVSWYGHVRVKGIEKRCKDNSYGYSWFYNGTSSIIHEIDPGKIPGKVTGICGPCNGILCLLLADSNEMVFWNPTTRTMRQVRKYPPQVAPYLDFGFGIDPLSGDFKIVVINHLYPASLQKIAFAVYNSRHDCWRLIEDEPLCEDGSSRVGPNCNGCTFSNGFCYWVKNRGDYYKSKSSLLEFDTRTDSFQEIELPMILVGRYSAVKLDLYNDVLALLTYQHHNNERRVDIWLMKERGRWTKLPTVFMPFNILGAFGICESNKIFAMEWTNRLGLIVYDPVSGETRDLGFERESPYDYQVLPRSYKENLARL